jgi:hypothetical protein
MGEVRKIAAILVADVVGYSRLAGDRFAARLRLAPEIVAGSVEQGWKCDKR